MKSLAGYLLIAPPQERDLDFIGTVILVIQHSEEQAFGVVLNRPTEKSVEKVWKEKKRWKCDQPVYCGGPVASPLMALHTEAAIGEIEVLLGVYCSMQKGVLEWLIQHPTGPFKIFSSHVGWGPHQLERFVEAGPWQILPASREHVFDAEANLWGRMSKLVDPSDEPG